MQIPVKQFTRPISEAPTTSPGYSQPLLHLTKNEKSDSNPLSTPSAYSNDVSPPESPRRNDRTKNRSQRSSFDVSPITASSSPLNDHFPKGGHRGSSIPIPAKHAKLGGAGALLSGSIGRINSISPLDRDSTLTTLTRWDDFSGEPTTSKTGKPAQAIPGTVSFESESLTSQRANLGNTTTISAGNDRGHKRYSNKPLDAAFTPKEAWKGASGRHTIINPLLDKPLPPGKTPSFPRGTQQIIPNAKEPFPGNKTSESANIHLTDPDPVKRSNILVNNESMGTYDSPESGESSFLSSTHLTPSLIETHDDTSSPTAKTSAELVERMQINIPPAATFSRALNVQELDVIENDFRAKMHHMHLEDQLPSRFSATTYATTAYDSPPATPEMRSESPIPTPPSSILNRKRPIPVAGIPKSRITARKPTPSDLSKSLCAGSEKGWLSKSLPKSPPEVQAVTRVASLEAKLENLRRRRGNLQTVIYELTHVFQPSSIAYDMASRQEIKKTVDGLHKELADVIKEEHETGLQLHRAWKRQDNDSAYENSSLWVKRLAS